MSDYSGCFCELNCQHEFFSSKKVKDLSFCKGCGIMKYKRNQTCKPVNLNYSCDFDQLEGFSDMLIEDTKINIDYESEYNKDYMAKRPLVLEFLKNLMEGHNFREAVYFLAVHYLDFILVSNPNINLKLATYASFLLASKFYEYDPKLLQMKQARLYLSGEFSENDIKKSEMICLKLLSYKLNRISSFDFLESLLKNGIVFEEELNADFDISAMYNSAFEIISFFLNDSRYLDFTPAQVSCAIITLVREKFGVRQGWNKKFSEIYNIKIEDFMNCYFVLKTLYSNEIEDNRNINFTNLSVNDFSCRGYNPNLENDSQCFYVPYQNTTDFMHNNTINNYNNNSSKVPNKKQNNFTLTPTNIINCPININSNKRICQSNYSNCSANYQSNDSALNSTIDEECFYYPVNMKSKNFSNSTNKQFTNSCNNQNVHFGNNYNNTVSPFNLTFSSNSNNRNCENNFTSYYSNYYFCNFNDKPSVTNYTVQ